MVTTTFRRNVTSVETKYVSTHALGILSWISMFLYGGIALSPFRLMVYSARVTAHGSGAPDPPDLWSQ